MYFNRRAQFTLHRHSTQIPHRWELERKRLWLLKNSLSGKRSKKLCVRTPYKRRSRFSWTFSIPQILPGLRKMDFFNTHGIYRQLPLRQVPRSTLANLKSVLSYFWLDTCELGRIIRTRTRAEPPVRACLLWGGDTCRLHLRSVYFLPIRDLANR